MFYYYHVVSLTSDDIQEAYKRLRRLVMDYLGIGMASSPTSELGEGDRGENTEQNMTTQMGTRTWSKSETMSQTLPRAGRAVQSPIPSGRGIVVG